MAKKTKTIAYYIKREANNLKIDFMAVNNPTGDGSRKGAVRERSQVQNPKTGLWTKRDSNTGQFIGVKTSRSTPFKGVRREKK